MSLNEIDSWMLNCLEKDFNDLSDKIREWYKEKYETIKDVVIKK